MAKYLDISNTRPIFVLQNAEIMKKNTATPAEIAKVKADHSKCIPGADGFTAVIVRTFTGLRKSHLGAQYWRAADIEKGVRTNLDRTESYYIEPLF